MKHLDKDRIMRIVENPGDTTHHTHGFHPYSAKFIPQLPNLLIQDFSRSDDTVLDPFCGSGTTLVEAKLLGRRSIGIDVHPLGAFMSRVKSSKIGEQELAAVPAILDIIESRIRSPSRQDDLSDREEHTNSSRNTDSSLTYSIPTFRNRDHWFQSHVIHELAVIKTALSQSTISPPVRDLMLLAFSSIIVAVSNQESETRYAFAQKDIPCFRTFQLFKNKVADMVDRMLSFDRDASDCEAESHCADAREMDFVKSNSVDLVVTSPPYPNTYDYYLYHKLRMIWLGMDWKPLKSDEIGSRLKHSSWRMGIDVYINDMTAIFHHLGRVLKRDGLAALVMGDYVIRGQIFRGDRTIADLAAATGFTLLDSIDYDLSLASRTFNRAFRNAEKKEHVILLANGN